MHTHFDPKNVILIFGPHHIRGFAEGTFIDVARAVDTYSTTAGSDGETVRTLSNNKVGTVTFTLMQNSKSNDALSAFLLADEESGSSVWELLIKEKNGTTKVAAPISYIKRWPNISYQSGSAATRTWIIEAPELYMFVGSTTELRPREV
jgi:hypothetical protein